MCIMDLFNFRLTSTYGGPKSLFQCVDTLCMDLILDPVRRRISHFIWSAMKSHTFLWGYSCVAQMGDSAILLIHQFSCTACFYNIAFDHWSLRYLGILLHNAAPNTSRLPIYKSEKEILSVDIIWFLFRYLRLFLWNSGCSPRLSCPTQRIILTGNNNLIQGSRFP